MPKKNDIQLTRHFYLSEFLRSDTATRLGIDNTPSIQAVSNLQYLCQQILEPLRDWAGMPLYINSGYRCPELNKAVGGSGKSQHLTGEACDIRVTSVEEGRKYVEYILNNCRFHQLIWEHNSSGSYWIHVSIHQDAPNAQHYIPDMRG